MSVASSPKAPWMSKYRQDVSLCVTRLDLFIKWMELFLQAEGLGMANAFPERKLKAKKLNANIH